MLGVRAKNPVDQSWPLAEQLKFETVLAGLLATFIGLHSEPNWTPTF